jgi:probable rRNA maturation factor
LARLKRAQVDINILFAPLCRSISKKWLREVVLTGLRVGLGPMPDRLMGSQEDAGPVSALLPQSNSLVQLGLVIVDDDTIRQLNKEYRGADEVTDVLSFSWAYPGNWQGDQSPLTAGEVVPFALDVQGLLPLGEVIVSYPQAQRQWELQGNNSSRELAYLIVHGVLHVLGYDHGNPDEEKEMKARESEALSFLFRGGDL